MICPDSCRANHPRYAYGATRQGRRARRNLGRRLASSMLQRFRDPSARRHRDRPEEGVAAQTAMNQMTQALVSTSNVLEVLGREMLQALADAQRCGEVRLWIKILFTVGYGS